MRFQTVYDNSMEIREMVAVYNKTPTMTIQDHKDECDINNIIARYNKTGYYVDPMKPGTTPPQWGDFSAVPDLMEVQNQLIEAEKAFMELPSELRRRFDNDPLSLLEFLQSDENREEAIKLGLIFDPPKTSENPVTAPAETPPTESAQKAT